MKKVYRIIKSLRGMVGLGILTLLFITTVIPAIAIEKPAIGNKTASRLLIKGKVAYESGKFSQAEEYWELAEHKFEQYGDRPHQALSLNYLSLANQELGKWQEADQYIDASLKLLQSTSTPKVLAQALNTQGNLRLSLGDGESALASWSSAEEIYRKVNDHLGIMGSKLNQAQALQQLGLYRRSQKMLEQLETELDREANPQMRVMGLRSLGNALQVAGDLEQSQAVLKESLSIAQELNLPQETSSILFSLGNTARSLHSYEAAIAFYEQAAARSTDSLTKVEAQLNQLSLLSRLEKPQIAEELISQVQSELVSLVPSRRSIYARVNLAKNLIDFNQHPAQTQKLLEKTIAQAQVIKDARGESYGLGILGRLDKQQQNLETAKQHTEAALLLATQINAEDIIYQWQWQLGRILQQQGDLQGAISAESGAVDSLEKIRGDLVAINPDAQYSFRESVEPIYGDLVGLLVSSNPDQDNLIQARDAMSVPLTTQQ
ncbi:MAG: tetratricopeptide repeat protein [Cyanobacteria bacterium J06600_6]